MTITNLQTQSRRKSGSVRNFFLPVAMALTLVATTLPMTASAATTQKISARVSGEVISVSVPLDLLTTEAGVVRLYSALERKADNACKKTIPMRLGRSVNVNKCTAALMDDFIADLDDAGMTARHAAAQ